MTLVHTYKHIFTEIPGSPELTYILNNKIIAYTFDDIK